MANTTGQLFLTMTTEKPPIRMQDFTYLLPEDRIALHPLPLRDQAKLLAWNKGIIDHCFFYQLPDFLPVGSTLFFNNTKVISARFLFRKETGATIEVFLLSPVYPTSEMAGALSCKEKTIWKCAVGNVKRWKPGLILSIQSGNISLAVRLVNEPEGLVEFSWTPLELTFAEVVHETGLVPLPPYIRRNAEPADRLRYQTIYSRFEGAVAAPTAGLHFTPAVLEAIQSKGIIADYLTLHVSAGTFLPVKSDDAADHVMHEEQVVIRKENLLHLLIPDRKVIAIGTTALRTLESLYWFGALLRQNPDVPFRINQNIPYEFKGPLPGVPDAIETILNIMKDRGIDEIVGTTSIFILPGYRFRVCDGLVTNFHQPSSTLLLLIAAFVGPDWKRIYKEAIENDYRFLSYGDSSLLLPG